MRNPKMRSTAVLAVILLLLSCATIGDRPAVSESRAWDGHVQVHGSLRAMFHEGQTSAIVGLDRLLPNASLYAVGALADLAGEVTVIGGRAYLSYPEGAEAARTEATLRADAAATVLVTAEVPAWRSIVTDRAIRYEALDEEIPKLAAAAGMGRHDRFPFLLEGIFEDIEWHVIDGRRLGAGGSSHQDHLAAAVRSRRDRTRAVLVGFYSERDEGVFTHMGSKTHIHCVVEEPLSAGHVDHVDVPAGITVRFPMDATGQ